MSVSNVYVLHGIKTPNDFYSQLEDVTPAPVANFMVGIPAGLPQPLFRGIRGLKPEVTFRTSQLATLLAECGLFSGADLSAGNVDLFYRKATNLGSRESLASAAHLRMRMTKAFMYIRSISLRHQQDSTAEVSLCAAWDGSNAPLASLGSQSADGTPAAAQYFGLGPVAINGTPIAGCTECSIQLGTALYRAGSGSEPYDTFIGISHSNPVITLGGLLMDAWATYGLVGTALTSLTIYGRKVNLDAAGGVCYVADGTAQHVSFSASKGTISVEQSRSGGNSEATATLRLELHAPDTTTDSITVNAATTIS